MSFKVRPTSYHPPPVATHGGTLQAESLGMERCSLPVDAPSASGCEGPIARALRVVTRTFGHNWVGIVENRRECVLCS